MAILFRHEFLIFLLFTRESTCTQNLLMYKNIIHTVLYNSNKYNISKWKRTNGRKEIGQVIIWEFNTARFKRR